MNIFILCAGSGGRWGKFLGAPKQFIKFNGEAIVDRTVRLLQPYLPTNIFYVARPGLFSNNSRVIVIDASQSLAETIRRTLSFWGDDNVFLLGDVFYSPASISTILNSKRNLLFFGRPWGSPLVNCGHGELFGLTIKKEAQSEAVLLLDKILHYVSREEAIGNLWNIHHLMSGLPFGIKSFSLENIQLIDDYTNDIDTPIDYIRRMFLYEAIAKNEVRRLIDMSKPSCQAPNVKFGQCSS